VADVFRHLEPVREYPVREIVYCLVSLCLLHLVDAFSEVIQTFYCVRQQLPNQSKRTVSLIVVRRFRRLEQVFKNTLIASLLDKLVDGRLFNGLLIYLRSGARDGAVEFLEPAVERIVAEFFLDTPRDKFLQLQLFKLNLLERCYLALVIIDLEI